MKTEWDYTSLADSYLKRPDYADDAINKMIEKCQLQQNDVVCDIGAGVGHLTLMMAKRGYKVYAVEPNDAMRANGSRKTKTICPIGEVFWSEGTGENTRLDTNKFNLVTFGSSFNVVDRVKALEEVKRISKPRAWFACMWNHRNVNDPTQKKVEEIICSWIPGYNYGLRREDQGEFLQKSACFSSVEMIQEQVSHSVSVKDWVEAWRSHATLQRQAGENFHKIVDEIENYLKNEIIDEKFMIPYQTKMWLCQLAT